MIEKARTALNYVIAFAMVGVGITHFVNTPFFVSIMPPWIPFHEWMVWLSGVAEIIVGILLAVPRTRKLGGWALIALLVAVFPANIHMAIHHIQPAGVTEPVPEWAAWGRLPLQFLFMGIAWWIGKDADQSASAEKPSEGKRA